MATTLIGDSFRRHFDSSVEIGKRASVRKHTSCTPFEKGEGVTDHAPKQQTDDRQQEAQSNESEDSQPCFHTIGSRGAQRNYPYICAPSLFILFYKKLLNTLYIAHTHPTQPQKLRIKKIIVANPLIVTKI